MRPTDQDARANAQGGFSLIELMVAMAVTLIVTGAIYGLMAGGQNAFRREPELSDRQQNTRIAMAMIEQDIEAAGVGMSPWVQAFTIGLDNVGPTGEDALEIVTAVAGCPFTPVCVRNTDNGNNMVLQTPIGLPGCFGANFGGGPQLAAAIFRIPQTATDVNQYVIGPLTNLGPSPGGACAAAGAVGNVFGIDASIQWDSGPPGWRTFWGPAPVYAGGVAVPAPNSIVPVRLIPVQVVRYEVAADPADPSGDPNLRHLWRSVTGGRTAADNFVNSNPPPGAQWQLVARGIQDLQVTYADGDTLAPNPPQVPRDTPQPIGAVGAWNTLVRQVNVTLSSRVIGANIAGFSGTDLNDPTQIRIGQLSSQIAPRAALVALQQAPAGANQWK